MIPTAPKSCVANDNRARAIAKPRTIKTLASPKRTHDCNIFLKIFMKKPKLK